MEVIKGVQDFPDLPTRRGKRPITWRLSTPLSLVRPQIFPTG